jgi:kinesin family protein 18/19
MLEVYHRSKEQRYGFDKIYRDQTSEEIYHESVRPLIKNVTSGRNATVFAYGPTGTGKTFTMLGDRESYGLKYACLDRSVLAIQNIFDLIKEDPEFEYNVVITYVEIYNEMIRDLLIPTSGYLELRDDSEKGTPRSMQAS